jgi:hypothetical protein
MQDVENAEHISPILYSSLYPFLIINYASIRKEKTEENKKARSNISLLIRSYYHYYYLLWTVGSACCIWNEIPEGFSHTAT